MNLIPVIIYKHSHHDHEEILDYQLRTSLDQLSFSDTESVSHGYFLSNCFCIIPLKIIIPPISYESHHRTFYRVKRSSFFWLSTCNMQSKLFYSRRNVTMASISKIYLENQFQFQNMTDVTDLTDMMDGTEVTDVADRWTKRRNL